jgi:hypothetical protein
MVNKTGANYECTCTAVIALIVPVGGSVNSSLSCHHFHEKMGI